MSHNNIGSIDALKVLIFRQFFILEFQIDFILCIVNHDNALRISNSFGDLATHDPMYLKCVTLRLQLECHGVLV